MVFPSNFYSRAVLDSITGQIWPAGRLLRTPALKALCSEIGACA